uniref:ras-related protein Rab-3A-like n=1 Tax=Monopterus albus TaxID=43700 RepID=UPI0009B38B55|nr:ras-related protein Rab-3A-like [Monopterus albus]
MASANATYGQKESSDQNFDYMFKILIIGNSSVGKTSFLFRYADDSFTPAFVSTVGIDFKVKTIYRNDKRIKLQIWDTAGQERYRTITTAYYRGAMGFILMYDITNEESFIAVQDWSTQIKTYSWDNAQVLLVGNKCDMEDERVVATERGQNSWAEEARSGAPFVEEQQPRNHLDTERGQGEKAEIHKSWQRLEPKKLDQERPLWKNSSQETTWTQKGDREKRLRYTKAGKDWTSQWDSKCNRSLALPLSPIPAGFEYFEASAKDNINVKQTFERLVDIICERMAESLDNNDPTVTGAKQGPQLNEQPQKSHQDCAC